MNDNFSPAELTHRDVDRFKQYKELLDFYHGRQWSWRASRGEKQLTFNYAKVVIDKVASYLMSGVHSTAEAIDGPDKAGTGRAEAALRQVHQENNLEQLDFETEVDCAILGDACFKVIWDAETKSVRVTSPDIQGIYAWWLGDAHLRGAEIDSADELIRIPANSGQQLYDVIEITDGRAGLDTQKKRVLGLILSYTPGRGEYQHRLQLGAV